MLAIVVVNVAIRKVVTETGRAHRGDDVVVVLAEANVLSNNVVSWIARMRERAPTVLFTGGTRHKAVYAPRE